MFEKIEKIKNYLILLMGEFYGDANWTIWINVWMDDTFQVTCRSTINREENTIFRDFRWYENEIFLRIYEGEDGKLVVNEKIQDYIV